jgi:hypothetical protein
MILASKLRSFIAGSTSQVLRSFSHQTYLVFLAKIGQLFQPNLCDFLGKRKSLPIDVVWHFSAKVK